MKVGYLGPGKVTFGYIAAEKFFAGKENIELIPFPTHTDVCQAAGEEEIDFGVVAVENVIDGIVTETIYAADRFSRQFNLRIYGEVEIPLSSCFCSAKTTMEARPLRSSLTRLRLTNAQEG